MIIRNRLASLIYRIAAAVSIYALLTVYLQTEGQSWQLLCYYGTMAAILYAAVIAIEVIANAIDLRRGIIGIPAGMYAPISTVVMLYCIEGGVLYFAVAAPTGYMPVTTIQIVFHALLMAIPFVDWLLFGEKGTVRFYNAFASLIFPVFYQMFVFFRAIIWNGDLLLNGKAYPYPVCVPSDPRYVWACVLMFSSFLLFSLFMIFFSRLLSGRYRKRRLY